MSLGMLAKAGDQSQARACYEEALKIDPKDFSALYNLHLMLRAEQAELAAEYLRRGLEAYPDSAMFIAMRGRQSGTAGNFKAACRDLAKALSVLPRRADFWNIYADFLQRDGQAAEAETARDTARRLITK
jgi:tetratricopeptide (TPR) repeat protein